MQQAEARVAGWTEGYAPLPGIPDEFIGPDGARDPNWIRLLTHLALALSEMNMAPDLVDAVMERATYEPDSSSSNTTRSQ